MPSLDEMNRNDFDIYGSDSDSDTDVYDSMEEERNRFLQLVEELLRPIARNDLQRLCQNPELITEE